MNRNMYWLLLATTTFTPSTKVILDRKLKALGISAPKYNLATVAEDAVSDNEETRTAAIEKLNDQSAFWYINPTKEVCKQVQKNLSKLRAKNFIRLHGAINCVADVTFVCWSEGADFHVNWVMNRKKAEELNKEDPEPTPAETFNVTVTNNATEIVTAVSPASGEVESGESFTATLTFADGKSASDIEVAGGTVDSTTLTVADVSSDTTVTITAKA